MTSPTREDVKEEGRRGGGDSNRGLDTREDAKEERRRRGGDRNRRLGSREGRDSNMTHGTDWIPHIPW